MFQKALSFGRSFMIGASIVIGPLLYAFMMLMGATAVIYALAVIVANIYVYPEAAMAVVATLLFCVGWAVMFVGAQTVVGVMFYWPGVVIDFVRDIRNKKREKQNTEDRLQEF